MADREKRHAVYVKTMKNDKRLEEVEVEADRSGVRRADRRSRAASACSVSEERVAAEFVGAEEAEEVQKREAAADAAAHRPRPQTRSVCRSTWSPCHSSSPTGTRSVRSAAATSERDPLRSEGSLLPVLSVLSVVVAVAVAAKGSGSALTGGLLLEAAEGRIAEVGRWRAAEMHFQIALLLD